MQSTGRVSDERTYRADTLIAYSQAVEQVIHAMHARLSDPLSLGEMAEIACLSPFHFNRVFRSLTDIPPGEFLAFLRLAAAKRLLLTTSLNVTDICFELGYTSLGAFTTRFKQLVGLSPLQLRQLANDLSGDSIQPHLTAHSEMRQRTALHIGGVSGFVTAPEPFAGLIFMALFPRRVSQHGPVACTTIAAPGPYHIGPVPDGHYRLLAAALPLGPDALTYLLPDSGMLVGVSERPALVYGGWASAPVNLTLRPLCPSDPPILGVFPPLLATPAAARLRIAR